MAVREFDAGRGGLGWWQAVRRSKDPAGFMVLFEDSAALAGLIIAAAGIGLSHATGDARLHGGASIAIGLILAAVAILLARDRKELPLGRSDERRCGKECG